MEGGVSREAANALFKAGDLKGAVELYSRVLETLGRPAASEEACAVLTNRALCHLRLDNATAAEADCTAVLDAKPGSEKALFRRALAREAQGRTRDALQDAGRLWQINPRDADAAKLLARLRATLQGVGVGEPRSETTSSLQQISRAMASSTLRDSASASAAAPLPHTLAACLSVLPPVLRPRDDESGDHSSSSESARLGDAAAGALLRGLSAVLLGPPGGEGASAGTFRAFCEARGPLRLAQLLPTQPGGGAAPKLPEHGGQSGTSRGGGSGGGGLAGSCVSLLAAVGGSVAAAHAPEWTRAWPEPEAIPAVAPPLSLPPAAAAGDAASKASLGPPPGLFVAALAPGSSAAGLLESLCEPVTQVLLPAAEAVLVEAGAGAGAGGPPAALGSGGAAAAASLEWLLRASSELLRAAAAVAQPAVDAGRGATLRDRANVGAGAAFLASLQPADTLPPLLRAALADWMRLAAAVLRHGAQTAAGPGPVHATAAACLASLLTSDAAVAVASDADALGAAAALLAALPTSYGGEAAGAATAAEVPQRLRQACTAALTRALRLLKDSHPLGYPDAGRLRLRRLLEAVADDLVGDLIAALPAAAPPPAAADSPAGAACTSASASSRTSSDGIVELGPRVPVGTPDWAPRPACAAMCAALSAALLVDRDEGLRLAGDSPGVLAALAVSSAAPWPEWQALAAAALSGLASDDVGRAALAGAAASVASCADASYTARLDFERGVLPRLADARTPATRAAASVALAKLTTPAKAFGAAAAAAGSATDRGGPRGSAAAAAAAQSAAVAESVAAVLIAAAGVDTRQAAARSSRGAAVPGAAAAAAGGSVDPLRIPFAQLRVAFDRRFGLGRRGGSSSADAVTAAAAAAAAGLDLPSACSAVEAVAVAAGPTPAKAWLVASDAFLAAVTRIAAAFASAAAAIAAADEASRSSSAPSFGDAPPPLSELRPAVYGLAHVIHGLCVSVDAQVAARLAEQGVDVAQWKELQRLAMPRAQEEGGGEGGAGSGGAGSPAAAEDAPAAVEARIRRLMDRCEGIVPLLASLADAGGGLTSGGGGDRGGGTAAFASAPVARKGFVDAPAGGGGSGGGGATRELVAQTLLAVAEHPWARGRLVAAGALPLLSDLAGSSDATAASAAAAPTTTLECALSAGQATARILISTPPSLVPPQQLLEAVPALLRVARDSSSGLQQFEAILGLTNVASASREAQDAIAGRRGGLGAIEVCQFSESLPLRRAGTECLTNLSVTAAGRRLIAQTRLPLWIALAREWGGAAEPASAVASAASSSSSGGATVAAKVDPDGLSSAALGGLAMALGSYFDAVADDDSGDGAAELAARAAVGRYVDHGAVALAAEVLLLPGRPALHLRACAILRHVAAEPRGVAALLTPLDRFDDGGGEAGGGGGEGAAATPSAFTLLSVLAQGRDPAAMAQGGKGGSRRTPPPPAPVVAAAATTALLRCIRVITQPPAPPRRLPPAELQPQRQLQRAWEAVLSVAAPPTEEEAAAAAAADDDDGVTGDDGGAHARRRLQLRPERPMPAALWALLLGVHASVTERVGPEAAAEMGPVPADARPSAASTAATPDDAAAQAVLALAASLVDFVGLA